MNWKLVFYISFTVIAWASAFIFNKICLGFLPPVSLAFYRYAIASVFFIPIAIYIKIKIPNRIEALQLALCGLMGIAVYNYFLYNGQLTVSAGVASLLVNTAPIFTTILSIFYLNERLKINGWLGLVISFEGVLLIVLGRDLEINIDKGALLVLGAAISFSFYHVIQKPLLKKFSSLEVIIYAMWFGALFLSFGLIELQQRFWSLPASIHFNVLYLAVFPGAIAYFTWAKANSMLDASKAAPFLYLTPVVAYILSFWVFEEVPNFTSILGGLLAIMGVFYATKFGK